MKIVTPILDFILFRRKLRKQRNALGLELIETRKQLKNQLINVKGCEAIMAKQENVISNLEAQLAINKRALEIACRPEAERTAMPARDAIRRITGRHIDRAEKELKADG